jgi:hypothetical protein
VEERCTPTEKDNHTFMVEYPKEASEKDKLTVKQIVAKFNIGKPQIVWYIKIQVRNKKSVATLR